jgi:hypothetical protein
MGWWNKVKHGVTKLAHKASEGADKLLHKGSVGGVKLFGKGSVGSQILSGASKGLDQVSNVTGKIGDTISKVTNNPVVAGILASNPLGEGILAGAKGLGAGLQGVSKTAGLASDLTKQKNYKGSVENVAQNMLEKAKGVHDSASGISFV